MKALHFIMTRVFNTPLLIHQQKLETILSVLQPRLPTMIMEDEDYGEREPVKVEVGGRSGEELGLIGGQVAIIPVYGSLVQRTSGGLADSGLRSYTSIERDLNEALNDPTVGAILFDVDSCGGEANGCFELADRIFEARQSKPIFGLANEQAFSGGYAILSACETIWAPKTGNVGSIGVVCTHFDYSQMAKKEGVAVTHIYAGKKKVDGSPYKPLSSTALKDFQAEIDQLYDVFTTTVARNRGVDVARVRATEAGTFMGKSAVDAGLVDEIISLADLPAKLQEAIMKREAKRAGASATAGTTTEEQRPTATTETPAPAPAANFPPADEDKDEEKEVASDGDETDDGEEEDDAPQAAAPAAAATIDRTVAAEITKMCAAVNQPTLAAEFIEKGLTVAQAKAALFDRMASGESPTISAVNPLRSGDSEAETLLVAAMRAQNDKGKK